MSYKASKSITENKSEVLMSTHEKTWAERKEFWVPVTDTFQHIYESMRLGKPLDNDAVLDTIRQAKQINQGSVRRRAGLAGLQGGRGGGGRSSAGNKRSANAQVQAE